jgi:hypothetical protein
VKLKAAQLCHACDMWLRRHADAAEEAERRTKYGRAQDTWERLRLAALRLTRATDLGWSERAVLSAEEQLKRAAEGYRRSCRRERRGRGHDVAA